MPPSQPKRTTNVRCCGSFFIRTKAWTWPNRHNEKAFKNPTYESNIMGKLHDYAKKVYSQNGEDGILEHIFDTIGTTNKKCIEMCAGVGSECNTANLIINKGFEGMLYDGSKENVERGISFFRSKGVGDKVRYIHKWITRSNTISDILAYKYTGDIDLLSLDMDGVDYWILKMLVVDTKVISPRVIVLEYNDIFGPERSITVPYDDNFDGWTDNYGGPNYCGASLKAFIKLLKDDYKFVGCNEWGFNGFFIKHSLVEIPEVVDIEQECFQFEKVKQGMKLRWPRVEHREWVYV